MRNLRHWLAAALSLPLLAFAGGSLAQVVVTPPTPQWPSTIPPNNGGTALTLTTPNNTSATCDTNPCAALFIGQASSPTTRNFDSGIWIQTNAATTDKGRGLAVNNLGASDGIYIQNDGVGATGLASLMTQNATTGTGMVIGTTLSGQSGLIVRQETAINPSAGSTTLLQVQAEGSVTEMMRLTSSTVNNQVGIISRLFGTNAVPFTVHNASDANTFQINNNGGIVSGVNGGAAGILALNGSTSGQALVFSNASGQLAFQGNSGTVFVGAANGTSGNINIAGVTSGNVIIAASATGGHVSFTQSGGANPTLTAGCNGAGSSVSGSDMSGTVTGSTAAATSCTLTFGTAFGSAPNCVAMGINSPLTGTATPSTTTLVVNFASTANYKFTYWCPGV